MSQSCTLFLASYSNIPFHPVSYTHLDVYKRQPYVGIGLLAGVALVLWSIWLGWRGSRKAIWLSGSGTVLTVLMKKLRPQVARTDVSRFLIFLRAISPYFLVPPDMFRT